jgi:hypothetical protein
VQLTALKQRLRQAAAEIRVLAKHFAALHPEQAPTGFYKGESLSVESLLSVGRPDVDKILYLLFVAVGLLMAIACTNGALLGCLLAWPELKALMAIIPPGDIPNEAVIRLNGTVLLFAALVALVATLFFGLAPALHVVRKDFQASLNSGGRGGGAVGETGRGRATYGFTCAHNS